MTGGRERAIDLWDPPRPTGNRLPAHPAIAAILGDVGRSAAFATVALLGVPEACFAVDLEDDDEVHTALSLTSRHLHRAVDRSFADVTSGAFGWTPEVWRDA